MADLKISQLTAITTLTPATDVLPVVDVTGTTKKITTNQILGSGGTATLASATITGDLTVKTNVLKVDSTNNRVGILTASPTAPLDILGNSLTDALLIRGNDNANTKIRMVNSGASGEEFSLSVGYPGASNSSFVLRSITAGINRYVADQTGAHFWATNAGTAMTLNATGLGVGVTPANDKLLVLNSIGINTSSNGDLSFRNIVGTVQQRIRYNDTDGSLTIGSAQAVSYAIYFGGNTTTRAMTLAASGKLLVGWTTAPTASASLFADGIQCTNTSGGGGYANLAIAGGGIGIYTHTGVAGSETYTERVRVKGTGQVRFVPLAADPAGAEAGDVYYNSVSNRLKYYNGTAWTLI